MKHILKLLILFSFVQNCFGQLPLTSGIDQNVRTTGFVYYVEDRFLTFVPVKSGSKKLDYNSFCSDSLGVGFRLSNEGINFYVEDAKKYGKEYPVIDLSGHSVILTVIPVEFSCIIYSYRWNAEIMKSETVWEKFKFPDKQVNITSVGMSINVTVIKPITGYN